MPRILAAAERLTEELESPEPRLDEVALAIAALDAQPLDEAAALSILDDWAGLVREHARAEPDIADLQHVLGEQLGLAGDREEYDAPENSFLPRVIATRRGLPILLSVIWIEVGRRVGIPLFGVGLPGHFVVGHSPRPGAVVLIDAFEGGARLSPAEVVALVERAGALFHQSLLAPASPRSIAVRMLRNLAGSYARRGRVDEARSAAQLWLAASPDDPAAAELFEELDRQARTVWS